MSVMSKQKLKKFIFGLAVPALILAIATAVVGVSFAWFSTKSDASVQTVELATQKSFVLEFDSVGANGENLPYMGQEALDESGYLIDPRYPATSKDAPYYFASEVEIGTQGQTKNLALRLENIKISKDGRYLDVYNESGEYDTAFDSNGIAVDETTKFHKCADIDLAFTWFFKAHTGDELASNKTEEGDEVLMKSLMPQGAETWYTPYGTMVFDADKNLSTLNGKHETALPSDAQDIVEFNAKSGTKFDFYIVFAPERVFWSMFFEEGRISAASYAAEELKEMLGSFYDITDPTYKMYYSQNRYTASKFSFNATLTATDARPENTP